MKQQSNKFQLFKTKFSTKTFANQSDNKILDHPFSHSSSTQKSGFSLRKLCMRTAHHSLSFFVKSFALVLYIQSSIQKLMVDLQHFSVTSPRSLVNCTILSLTSSWYPFISKARSSLATRSRCCFIWNISNLLLKNQKGWKLNFRILKSPLTKEGSLQGGGVELQYFAERQPLQSNRGMQRVKRLTILLMIPVPVMGFMPKKSHTSNSSSEVKFSKFNYLFILALLLMNSYSERSGSRSTSLFLLGSTALWNIVYSFSQAFCCFFSSSWEFQWYIRSQVKQLGLLLGSKQIYTGSTNSPSGTTNITKNGRNFAKSQLVLLSSFSSQPVISLFFTGSVARAYLHFTSLMKFLVPTTTRYSDTFARYLAVILNFCHLEAGLPQY